MDPNQTSIFTAVLITCVILAVVITYFIASIIRYHRRNIQLYKAKILAEVTTLEKERARIANDLHDEVGPILSAAKLRINSLDIESKEDVEELGKINKNIDDIIQRMRTISNDLLPNTLQRKGLIPAMNESIGNMSNLNSLEIRFNYENIPDLPKEISVNLYRILQEVIHNTIKHARATELNIQMTNKKHQLHIISEDNGIGFNYSTIMKDGRGLGLRNLLNRTEILHGEMFVESKIGKGTQYIFEIPIQ
ncbi:MAG TPA: ATP-binding protein [Chitinophagaceae bacterium]|nr:ATP-binding protein [Chitinophagaceae bacterium]